MRTIALNAAASSTAPEVVDLVVRLLLARGQRRREHDERDDADRQVDVEDPAPREVGRQEAAEQRADNARESEHRAEQPLVTAALARRDDVADRRHRPDHQAATAEPLHAPEHDQFGEALRQAAERRAGEEDHQRDLEHDLAPVEVAELAVHRRDRRLREQVRGHDPGDVAEAAEVADDRRQRGRDDRLVQRRHQQHEHQPGEDDPDAGAALGDRFCCRGGCHSNSPPAGSSRRSADRCASAVSVQTTSASPAVAAPSTQTPLQPLLA